ncbi:MAG: PD-(D/E)XK nuclease family protein [Chloroflexota bacterium]
MTLPSYFQFSQGSLQDYALCPRRFQLRYIEHLSWPALDAEPALENEHHLRLGEAFHLIVQQYLLGIPEEHIAKMVKTDTHLSRWWENFIGDKSIQKLLNNKAIKQYTEIMLSVPIGQYRLAAKFDLILIEPGRRAIIFDWKTIRKQTKYAWMAKKYQTRVYPFVLSQAGAHLNKNAIISPEQIEMIYWFANFPDSPLRFSYNAEQKSKDKNKIEGLIREIQTLGVDPAPLTDNDKLCRYCVYRSLCNRGVEAGPLHEFENADFEGNNEFEIDFEQIEEIAF